ncbi:MAG: hypothetical protein ACK5IQ_09625 [Bacteroidales bacterium]
MSESLHIQPFPQGEQKFSKQYYELILPKAGKFRVGVKEFIEEDLWLKADKEQLEKEHQEVVNYVNSKWKEHAAEGWSEKKLRENFDANIKSEEERRNLRVKIEAHNKRRQALREQMEDLAWKWEIRKSLRNSSEPFNYNEMLKNELVQNLSFPKVLEGGGYVWLEPFRLLQGATGKQPNGCYVKALGKPKIVSVEWTKDPEGNTPIYNAEIM